MNTFWTLIDDEYYRIYQGELRYAPKCEISDDILVESQEKVETISAELLEKINTILGTNLSLDDL